MTDKEVIAQLKKQVTDLKEAGAAAISELTNAIEFCETGREGWPAAHERIDEWEAVCARTKAAPEAEVVVPCSACTVEHSGLKYRCTVCDWHNSVYKAAEEPDDR
jgi:hypothetical protein